MTKQSTFGADKVLSCWWLYTVELLVLLLQLLQPAEGLSLRSIKATNPQAPLVLL